MDQPLKTLMSAKVRKFDANHLFASKERKNLQAIFLMMIGFVNLGHGKESLSNFLALADFRVLSH